MKFDPWKSKPIRRYPKGSREKISDHFRVREFDCRCKSPECKETLIDLELVELLERVREDLNFPIGVTSGYRCDSYHEELGKQGRQTAKNSTHCKGQAADIWTGKHTGLELEVAARKAGFLAVGVASVWAHVDTRRDKVRSWRYI